MASQQDGIFVEMAAKWASVPTERYLLTRKYRSAGTEKRFQSTIYKDFTPMGCRHYYLL